MKEFCKTITKIAVQDEMEAEGGAEAEGLLIVSEQIRIDH
jgi:hypothetical protein